MSTDEPTLTRTLSHPDAVLLGLPLLLLGVYCLSFVLLDRHVLSLGLAGIVAAPLVADVATDGDAGVLWIDVEDHPAIAARYDVRVVPTLVAFDGGEPAERLVGRQDRSTVEAVVSA